MTTMGIFIQKSHVDLFDIIPIPNCSVVLSTNVVFVNTIAQLLILRSVSLPKLHKNHANILSFT